MSQFAATPNPFGPQGDTPLMVPQRTSTLAISSLVCSLLCCIPVVHGTLGLILGVAALIRISASGGRLGGRGLAIAGIIISLLITGVYVGGAIGIARVWSSYVVAGYNVASAAHGGDVTLLRTKLSSNTTYTDEQIKAFSTELNTKLGNLKPQPNSIWESWDAFSRYITAVSKAGTQRGGGGPGPQNGQPVVFDYDNGPAMLIMSFDPGAPPAGQLGPNMFDGMLDDVAVILPDGTVIRLSDMPTTSTPGAPGSAPKKLVPDPSRPSSEG